MRKSDYIKQIEAENEALRKRLEEAALKADCYEFIMNNLKTKNRDNPAGLVMYRSTVSAGNISLVMSVTFDKHNICAQKISNDFIEDEKMMEGHDKK